MLAVQPEHSRQTIISPELSAAYDEAMAEVEASHGEASDALSRYWWNLYRIKRDNLWRAKYEDGRFADWLDDIHREPFGPSKSDFYMVCGTVERFMRGGMTEEEVRGKLGFLNTALKGDLAKLFDKKGKGDLLPEVAKQLQEEGITFKELVEDLTAIGPGEARARVSQLTDQETIYALEDDWSYDERIGRLMVNFRWETREDGLVWTGTVNVTASELTSNKKYKDRPNYLPERVAKYILSRFGIRH